MKLVYLAKTAIPSRTANSIHVVRMCQAFVYQGHEVTLVIPELEGVEPDIANVYDYYGVRPIFDIVKTQWPRMNGADLVHALKAVRLARRNGCELVYGRSLEGCFVAAVTGFPVVFEFHSSPDHLATHKRWMFYRMVRSHNFKRLVVISEALKRHYVDKHGIPESRVLVAHDAADEPTDVSRLTLGTPGRLQAAYIGHLYPGKGMEVIQKLAVALPSVDFHVVGGAEKDIAYWKLQSGQLSNLFFQGFVEPSRVEQYRQGADVLLAPFQRKVMIIGKQDIGEWMSPLKIFEYLASRKPIVVSDLPVLREVLNEDNAIIVPPDDVEAWKQALMRLQDPVLRERLAARAYQDFLTHYTWKERARKVLARL